LYKLCSPYLVFFSEVKKVEAIAKANSFNLLKLRLALKSSSGIIAVSCIFFLGRFNDGVIMLYLKKCGFAE